MRKRIFFVLGFFVLFFVLFFSGGVRATHTQCSDAIDNDLDGYIDGSDPGCVGIQDNSELNCWDSDGTDYPLGTQNPSEGYNVLGYTRSGPESAMWDACSGSQIVEKYCNTANNQATITTNCPLGRTCSGGACVQSCSDSDGGNVPNTQGTVQYYVNGVLQTSTDSCSNPNMLAEAFCTAGNLYF